MSDGKMILEGHRAHAEDDSPMQMISAHQLAYLRQCERNLFALLGELLTLQKYKPNDTKPEAQHGEEAAT